MTKDPIWRLVQDAARELTLEGKVPFTRTQLVERVREQSQMANPNTINPVIQGLTDNLKGGAPVADGKRILHSVGRGKFVLYSKRSELIDWVSPQEEVKESRHVAPLPAEPLPDTESALRDLILQRLTRELGKVQGLSISAEGRLPYRVDGDHTLYHASDILIEDKHGRYVSMELKYKSSVTDQFKCRSYDAMHMKKQYGDDIHCVMLYAKSKSGISIEHARRICYAFDYFLGLPAGSMIEGKAIAALSRNIEEFFSRD